MSRSLRICVVSAYYPPNFISGGTLQPQRLARGLRARGHDVSVFAGWKGEGRPPLSTFDEVDETGLPVHWIDISPFSDWSDPRNYRNPPVRDHFVRYLDRVQPDVVHFHPLQSFGASLVRAAKEAGAATVVTMHDFWWWCARQFLVDRSFRPCSLVVEAGVCECEVDRPYLEQRNRELAGLLPYADLVLAPSTSAAAVLAANGVDPARLEVDENGLPEVPRHTQVERVRAPGEPVRFVYTGGTLEMKGSHVLVAAAASMVGEPGWRVIGYGLGDYLDRLGGHDVVPGIEVRPPFPPDRLDEVMAEADVVLVPSVMRESFSIVTREALQRGVPVLCTDSLGPEEVVVDGVNGIVVPSADPTALATAMRRLIREPGLLERLTAGARAGNVRVRSIDDQVAVLEQRMLALVDREHDHGRITEAASTPSPTSTGPQLLRPGPPRIRRVLFVAGIHGAPLRYRAMLPAEAIGLFGVESELYHYRNTEVPAAAARADVIVVYRSPASHQLVEVIDAAQRRGVPVLFDVDDLIVDPDIASEIPALQLLPPDEAAEWLDGVCAYRTTLEHCDGYVGSTAMLVDHISRLTGLPAARFDNGVGIALGRASSEFVRRRRRPGPLRIGYFSGTITHDHDWQFVLPAVTEVLDRHPRVQLWAGGYLPDTPELERYGRRVRRVPFQHWLELPGALRNLDVNLAPLVGESRFNEAKSAIKWLEAALVETPTVATPTGPFREAIEDGQTGFLADTHDEWVEAITRLLDDSLLRAMMGARARRAALLGWSPWLQGRRYLQILEQAFLWREQAADRPSSWSYPLRDEPFDAFGLFPDGLNIPSPWSARLQAIGGRRQLPLRTVRKARALARRALVRS